MESFYIFIWKVFKKILFKKSLLCFKIKMKSEIALEIQKIQIGEWNTFMILPKYNSTQIQ